MSMPPIFTHIPLRASENPEVDRDLTTWSIGVGVSVVFFNNPMLSKQLNGVVLSIFTTSAMARRETPFSVFSIFFNFKKEEDKKILFSVEIGWDLPEKGGVPFSHQNLAFLILFDPPDGFIDLGP